MKTERKIFGFTIVELLTVMAVIAMLMGLLVPALNLVRRLAKDTNQRAEFHSIDVALETYVNEGENQPYPASKALVTSSKYTVGAQRLTEALLGRDLVGLDPNTSWDAKLDEDKTDVYASKAKGSSQSLINASLARRQGPYLNPGNAEAFQVGQLFTSTSITSNVYDGSKAPAPVLTDVYRVKKVVSNGRTSMAGTPILYYRANVSSLTFPDVNDHTTLPTPDCNDIYCSRDNDELLALGQVQDQTLDQYFYSGYTDLVTNPDGGWIFYNAITNKQIAGKARPYNMTSYILISAGPDGIYGTRDDICNFK